MRGDNESDWKEISDKLLTLEKELITMEEGRTSSEKDHIVDCSGMIHQGLVTEECEWFIPEKKKHFLPGLYYINYKINSII